MKLVLASQNAHKLEEMQNILGSLSVEVVLQSELGLRVEVEETGKTFEENSALKAEAVFRASGLPSIADDSGLMVDALNGAPGVYSHRFGEVDSDEARRRYLLQCLQETPEEKRTAKFVTVITCIFRDGRRIAAEGVCEGIILREERGNNGFGYDPLFYYPPLGKTFAEMTPQEKNAVSHRARALQAFCEKYRGMFSDDDK